METLNQSVIVFSQNYLPLNKVNIKRAIALLVTGKAEPMDFSNIIWEVKSSSFVISVPAYIRLHYAPERVWKVPAVSRREIFKRDSYQCQYCGNRKQLTIDHIIPRSKGGKHIWNNVVTACATCNGRKGNRTPEQAGLKLTRLPKAPIHPTVTFAEQVWQQIKGIDRN
jgi:5-methylcytosine-specific restriction endonuclease McrA